MVKSERLCTTDPFVQVTFQRSNKDHTCKFTLQDFLHSNQKLKDEANKSRLENSLITACFCSHRWAICVTLGTERVLPRKIKFCKIWMNQGMWPVMWPWLAAGNRNIRNCTKQSSPSVSSVRAFAKQTMAVCRRISPRRVPLPYFDASTSPLESFFDSLQLSVSLHVQIDRTVEYDCFAVTWDQA